MKNSSLQTITVSAPGKLMIMGEHAVLYNRPCIVAAVGQRMFATLESLPDPAFELEAPDVDVHGYKKSMTDLGVGDVPKGAKFVEIAVKNFTATHPLPSGVRITTKSEFSSLFGFGSSSASTVCVMKGLAEISGVQLSNKELFELSYKTVLDIQGKGSGFDVAAAIYGGTLYFVTGGKEILPIYSDSLPLVIGYTGIKADTVTIMGEVSKRAEKNPDFIDSVYTYIGTLVSKALSEIQTSNWKTVGHYMDLDQDALVKLEVSSTMLDEMIHAARNAGAYGAKLSGAGGGDCMIALVSEEKRQAVSDAITSVGGKVIDIPTNVEGVRVETM